MKYIITIITALLLNGCIPEDIDYTKRYDPNEKIINGKILLKSEPNKEIIKQRLKNQESSRNIELTLSTILSVGTGIFMMPYNVDDSVPGNPTEYDVKLKNGKTLKIFNYYSGFAVGECVKVFISPNWKKFPPRMASGGEC